MNSPSTRSSRQPRPRDADLIVVLDGGRVEAGDHAALLARRGVYARLVGRQMAGVG